MANYVLAVIALTFTACKNEQHKDGNNDNLLLKQFF